MLFRSVHTAMRLVSWPKRLGVFRTLIGGRPVSSLHLMVLSWLLMSMLSALCLRAGRGEGEERLADGGGAARARVRGEEQVRAAVGKEEDAGEVREEREENKKKRKKENGKRRKRGKKKESGGGRTNPRNRKNGGGRLQGAGGGKQNCQGELGQTLGFGG